MQNQVTPDFFKKIQAHDVKQLVAGKGCATLHGLSCKFASPSYDDAGLCTILQDNKCTVKIVGQPTSDCATYELCGHGKCLQVKIAAAC